jgi:hypothetical protein
LPVEPAQLMALDPGPLLALPASAPINFTIIIFDLDFFISLHYFP